MRDFEHKHVLSLKGIVEIKGNFCLVFKWMENGALNSYVKKNKSSISFRQLLSFCRDIADGMAYLAQRNVFHRDLAARNCLLDGQLLVKGISIFSNFGNFLIQSCFQFLYSCRFWVVKSKEWHCRSFFETELDFEKSSSTSKMDVTRVFEGKLTNVIIEKK